jgi:hypothetical protein
LVEKVHTRLSKTLNFINFCVFTELRIKVVIIVIIILLDFFFLIDFLAIFISLDILSLDLVRSAALLSDLLVEGQNLVIMIVVRRHQVVELGQ